MIDAVRREVEERRIRGRDDVRALVDRSSQHLRLTDAGVLPRQRAIRLIDDADDLRAALDGLAERPRGRLKINAPNTFAVGLIAPMLAGFAQDYPDIRIVLDIDNKLVDLHATDVDPAIRVGALADSELVAQKLSTAVLWACASPGHLAARGTPDTPHELARHILVGRVDAVSSWGFHGVDGECVEVVVQPDPVVPEPAVSMTLAIDDAGIARLPDFIARDAIACGRLVRLLPDWQPDHVDIHALYTSRRALPVKARVFIAALLAHLRAS